jgi:hypothetical protein
LSTTPRRKAAASGGAFASVFAFVVIMVVLMVRGENVTETVESLDLDVFLVATFDGGAETDPLLQTEVPSALDLLEEVGFDSESIGRDLLSAGVLASAFALPDYSPFGLADDQRKQRACLAQAIYYEARNQPVLGRLAVADVVLNRVADPRFPDTICRVVFQGQARSYACQFSFACDGSLNRARELGAWQKAQALADIIYRGFRPPLTRFATFYHADYVSPYWASAFNETAVIGDHVFYRPPGALKLAANRLGVALDPAES